MAAAGIFPKAAGDIVYQDDYNTIQSAIASVVNTYYDNTLSSVQLSGNPIITAAQLDLVRLDISKGYKHIVGSNPSITDVSPGDLILASTWNTYKTLADYCVTNKDTIAPAQRTQTSSSSNALTSAWNGSHAFTTQLTWSSAAKAEAYFNTQSRMRITVGGSNSLGTSKDAGWLALLNAVGVQYYNNTNWDAGGTITIVNQYGSNYYAENYCSITATKVSSTVLTITVNLNDADVGDPFVDENVNVDASAIVVFDHSYDAITVTLPTVLVTANW